MKSRILLVCAFAILFLVASGCRSVTANGTTLSSSGTLTADETHISSELGGKIKAIHVQEGDAVSRGQLLFELDTTLLDAQKAQAQAAVQLATSNRKAAQASLAGVQAKLEAVQSQVFFQPATLTRADWNASQPSEFEQPAWYFSQSDMIAAANAEIDASQKALDDANAALQTLLADPAYKDVSAAEQRLTQAQLAFEAARNVRDLANSSFTPNQALIDSAQAAYDSARTELDAAQQVYSDLLGTQQAQDLQTARADVQTAKARLDQAYSLRTRYLTGSYDPNLTLAQSAVDQAQALIDQAVAAEAQAQAALDLINVQESKCQVVSPVDGVITAENLAVGEIVTPGGIVMTISVLDPIRLTAYVTEDQYGLLKLADKATISTDSFPGETFSGSVTNISDQAEFSPRNVQTSESRSGTYYAITITIANTDGKLKPGMPVNVTFAITP
jgi:HlyD family secretion protein